MHKPILLCAISIALAWPSLAATPKRGSKRTGKTSVAQSHAAKPGTGASHLSRTKSRGAKPSARPAARRSYQQTPTPERYKEIQQVLTGKGYFKGPVDGHWGADSVEALRRFQADQNLEPDGKLGALSLIALGLGPKRLSAQTVPSTPPTPSTSQPTVPR